MLCDRTEEKTLRCTIYKLRFTLTFFSPIYLRAMLPGFDDLGRSTNRLLFEKLKMEPEGQ